MTSLAMLFQTDLDPAITGDRLVAQMLTDFPDLDAARLSVDPDTDPGGPLSLMYGDVMIALMGIDAPVGDDLPEIAQYSRLWPDTVPAPASYGAHTIVTVLRPGAPSSTHDEAIDDARLLSKVIASAIALTETVVAVYFGSANHVVLPPLFRELAIETLPEPLLPAWVALNVAPRADGVMTAHTRGLDMLGLMDIEILESPESAEESFGRIANIAIYQLENGPVIGDRDTLGATEEAEIVAHHVPSALDPERTVLQLTFGADSEPQVADDPEPAPDQNGASPKKGWFRRR